MKGRSGLRFCAIPPRKPDTGSSSTQRLRRKVIIEAGAIALSNDRGPVHLNPNCGFGRVLNLAGEDLNLTVSEMSQEHGVVIGKGENGESGENTFDRLRVGSRVRVLANHSCLTAAQRSHYNVLEGEKIVDHWKIHAGW